MGPRTRQPQHPRPVVVAAGPAQRRSTQISEVARTGRLLFREGTCARLFSTSPRRRATLRLSETRPPAEAVAAGCPKLATTSRELLRLDGLWHVEKTPRGGKCETSDIPFCNKPRLHALVEVRWLLAIYSQASSRVDSRMDRSPLIGSYRMNSLMPDHGEPRARSDVPERPSETPAQLYPILRAPQARWSIGNRSSCDVLPSSAARCQHGGRD